MRECMRSLTHRVSFSVREMWKPAKQVPKDTLSHFSAFAQSHFLVEVRKTRFSRSIAMDEPDLSILLSERKCEELHLHYSQCKLEQVF